MGDRKVLRTYNNAVSSVDAAIVLDAGVNYALRLYDASIKEDELDREVQIGFRDNLKQLKSLEDKLEVYNLLRKKALVYDIVGDKMERNRHLEAALYFMVNFI